jgi:S-DNA-T family DNA segregation ATPase FtsK/SpoIIIE
MSAPDPKPPAGWQKVKSSQSKPEEPGAAVPSSGQSPASTQQTPAASSPRKASTAGTWTKLNPSTTDSTYTEKAEEAIVEPDVEPVGTSKAFRPGPVRSGIAGTTFVPIPPAPEFNRPPREVPQLPEERVEILEPEQAPSPPSTNLVSILLPVGGTLLGVVIMVVATVLSTGLATLPVFAFISLPMMLFSVLGGVYNHRRSKNEFEKKSKQRLLNYEKHLAACRQAIEDLAEKQRQAVNSPHPGIKECLERAKTLNARLWERQPLDLDFLDLRLGLGCMSRSFEIKPPTPPRQVQEPDPLYLKAKALADEFYQVDRLAIPLKLTQVGSAGICGPRKQRMNLAQALIIQLATNHAPTEVKLVLVVPEEELDEWEWITWLPHIWNDDKDVRNLAADLFSASSLLSRMDDLLNQRLDQAAAQLNLVNKQVSPAFVFILADPALWIGSDAEAFSTSISLLLSNGNLTNAYPIFLAEQRTALPDQCGAVIDLSASKATITNQRPEKSKVEFTPDSPQGNIEVEFARSLAPLRFPVHHARLDLPKTVPFLSMFGKDRVEDLPILENWKNNDPNLGLAVPLGRLANGKLFVLDIQDGKDGPNGLVAGTVGSGKSEFLQALVLSLAIHFDPSQVVFAILDFKGGDFCAPLRILPHVVSHITNLEMEDVPRAILSLKNEVDRRESLFETARNTYGTIIRGLKDYNRLARIKGIKGMPYIVLIVDEFKVLKDESESDLNEFIRIAITGRSLGLRMILAAQKPDKSVISPQIAANTQIRLSFPLVDPEESKLILDRPDAAFLSGPGRGVVKVTAVRQKSSLVHFQSAYPGATYNPDSQASQNEVVVNAVGLDGRRQELFSSRPVQLRPVSEDEKQITILAGYMQKLFLQLERKKLDGPWLSPLPKRVHLSQVGRREGGWDGSTWQPSPYLRQPLIGLMDDPTNKTQGPLSLDLDKIGNLVLYGSHSSAKMMFLESMITSLALENSPQDLHLYLMDFGMHSMEMFAPLPHVGAVIMDDEPERARRLLTFLSNAIETRKKLLGKGLKSISELRAQKVVTPAEIVVVLHNYATFARMYSSVAKEEESLLVQIAGDGPACGIHLVITTDDVGHFPPILKSRITATAVMELGDPNDYLLTVGKPDMFLSSLKIPGRGLIRLLKGQPLLEFQAALAGDGPNEADQNASLAELFRSMEKEWAEPIPGIPPVPDVLALAELLNNWTPSPSQQRDLSIPLGVDVRTPALDPFCVALEDGPHFWIAGPGKTGKTTLLSTWLVSLAKIFSPDQVGFYLIDVGSNRLEGLKNLPHKVRYISQLAQLNTLDISTDLQEFINQPVGLPSPEMGAKHKPAVVIAISKFTALRGALSPANQAALENLAKKREPGLHLLVAGSFEDFQSTNNPIASALKGCRAGFFVGTSDAQAITTTFYLTLGSKFGNRQMQPGDALFAKDTNYSLIRLATCQGCSPSFDDWVETIRQAYQK